MSSQGGPTLKKKQKKKNIIHNLFLNALAKVTLLYDVTLRGPGDGAGVSHFVTQGHKAMCTIQGKA